MRLLLVIAICVLARLEVFTQQQLTIEADAIAGNGRTVATFSNLATGTESLTALNLISGSSTDKTTTEFTSFHNNYVLAPNDAGYTGVTNYNDGLFLRTHQLSGKIRFYVGGTDLTQNRMTITNKGIGIGTDIPRAALQVAQGDFLINDPAQLIMQSPNNTCYRITMDNGGNLNTTSVTCP